jgi:hypothetical protein
MLWRVRQWRATSRIGRIPPRCSNRDSRFSRAAPARSATRRCCHFIPYRDERYDLVIMESEVESAPIKAMLDALNSRRFAREVSQLCAYETIQMGQVIHT